MDRCNRRTLEGFEPIEWPCFRPPAFSRLETTRDSLSVGTVYVCRETFQDE